MVGSFINLENVCEAAALLVTADTYHIKTEVIEDAEDFIVELKTALDNFNNLSNDRSPKRYSHTMLFDKHLSELLNATKNLYDILTEDSKDKVKNFLEHKKQIHKNVFIPFDN